MPEVVGSEEVLSAEAVVAAWDEDPTLTLLRAHGARWVLPLFSRHLEFAHAPVSAPWFHTRVAEALAQNPDYASDVQPAEHCKNWVDNRWLVRTRTRDDDGEAAILYRLSPASLRALRMVRGLVRSENTVSEARLGSISDAVRTLADMANPDPAARAARVDEQIAALKQRKKDILAGRVRGATAEETRRQVGEVLRLTESLPEDFRHLGQMVETRHRDVSRRASAENFGKGEIVEAWLRENDLLDQTPEGRAYRGFAQALSTRAVEKLRTDIDEVLKHDLAAGQMTPVERLGLESLVSSLLAEEHVVQESYLRWTASLRRYLTRTVSGRHQRLIELTEEALTAGMAWVQAAPQASQMPDVLGIGPLALRDMSQAQLWRDPGDRSVDVVIDTGLNRLPESEMQALRLGAGTSAVAVAGTINALFESTRLAGGTGPVSGKDIYEATPLEFRRIGTMLSMIDLAIAQGRVTEDEPEVVEMVTANGHVLQVAVPHIVFDQPVTGAAKGPRARKQSEKKK